MSAKLANRVYQDIEIKISFEKFVNIINKYNKIILMTRWASEGVTLKILNIEIVNDINRERINIFSNSYFSPSLCIHSDEYITKYLDYFLIYNKNKNSIYYHQTKPLFKIKPIIELKPKYLESDIPF